MPKYIVERELKDAGKLTPDQLRNISQLSCEVLEELGPKIQWMHSYVTENKIFCVYLAADKALIEEHARKAGFPLHGIRQVSTVIAPDTSE